MGVAIVIFFVMCEVSSDSDDALPRVKISGMPLSAVCMIMVRQ